MAASTDIKWFRYKNKNAPQITNNWGAITPVLDACLVTGFSEQVVKDVEISSKVVKLIFDEPTDYLLYQVIEVSGSDLEAINGQFRITRISQDTKEVYYELETSSSYVTTGGYVIAKLASLGWEKAYEGVGKGAYRSTNEKLNTRPYLRVVDGNLDNYNTTYIKYARVGIVEDMTGIDNLAGVQAPYDSIYPNKNWDTTMVGATAYHGWAKWYYTWVSGNYGSAYGLNNTPVAGNRDWIIIGDSDRFYFILSPNSDTVNTNYRLVYGFGAYDTFIRNDYSNTFLFASNDFRTLTSTVRLKTMAPATYWYGTGLNYTGINIFLQREYSQIATYSQAHILSIDGVTHSGIENNHGAPNTYATTVPFPCYLRDTQGFIRGNLPNYFWLGQQRPLDEMKPVVNNKDEILMPIRALAPHESSSSSIQDSMIILKIGDL